VDEYSSPEGLDICGGGTIISVNPEMCCSQATMGSLDGCRAIPLHLKGYQKPCAILGNLPKIPFSRRFIAGWLLNDVITSGLATIQPELMDACLDWMACISIDASWLLS
jgi:hypothetical protein